MKVPRTRRADGWKDEKHLNKIRALPCCICGAQSEAAHIRRNSLEHGKFQAVGQKPHDKWTVPLCPQHHRLGQNAQHMTNEGNWWRHHGINPEALAVRLYETNDVTECERYTREARRLFPYS